MPQTKSNIKNIKVILRNRNNNRKYKLSIKRAIKKYLISLKRVKTDANEENVNVCKSMLSNVYKTLDKAVNKSVLHKNHAARKKSRLVKLLR